MYIAYQQHIYVVKYLFEEVKSYFYVFQHFSRLMQKHYNNGSEFEHKIIEKSDDPLHIAEKAIHLIEELGTINPMKGYNSFFDGQGIGKRGAKLNIYDEDVLFYFLKNNKSKTLKKFDISSNVFDYRIQRQGFGQQGDAIPISTYESLYCFCAQEAVLSPAPISASNLMDRCFRLYDVSRRLRPTPHKISKNLKAFGIPQIKKNGLIYFTSNDN